MRVGKLGRCLAAVTLVGLAATGCTPDPGPTTPTPTPSVSQTPTESPQEMQQRLDYEAAEKSYRTFRAEYRKVLRNGGADNATPAMKATAGGPYLKELVEVIRGYKEIGAHQEGMEIIKYVRPAGYSSTSIALDVCEDDRPVDVRLKSGKKFGTGEVRTARLDLRKESGKWKVWEGGGTKVDSCE